jgi:outer membrane protein assembly factor BamB
MRKQWIKRIGIFTVVIIIACTVLWSTVRLFYSPSLSSKEFPLLEKWTTKVKGDIQQLTIVDNSIVIVRTMTEIYALDMQSGNILWQQSIAWHFSYHPPLAKNGKIFLSDGKGVLALNQSDGKLLWQQALRHPSGAEVVDVTQDLVAVNDPPYLVIYQAGDGTLIWDKRVCREPAQAYFFDTNIVVPCYGLNAIDALSGETVWETQSEDGVDRIWKSAFADGVIYYSQDLESITAYDVKNRKQLWKTPLAEKYDSFQAYKVMGDHLLVTIDDHVCALLLDDGRNSWCNGDLIKPRNPTSFEGMLYLFNGLQKGITANNLQDGSQIGRLNFPAYIFITSENDRQLMVTSDEFLIFANGGNIYAYGK